MIFGGRSLQDLTLDDFRGLVKDHAQESLWLEFKAAQYPDNQIQEMLYDISALANADGGYLIIGIKEDGRGRAAAITPVEKSQIVAQSIRQRCLDGIVERIDGLEIESYECSPDGDGIIVVHIPTSKKKPHMVARDRRTDFYLRHGPNKFNMTFDEIRHAMITSSGTRERVEAELLSTRRVVLPGEKSRTNGPPYARIFTEGAVNQFLQKYMTYQTFPQVLVIVSPFISNLAGELYELQDIIAHINKTRTPTYVITRELKDDYQKESIALLSQSPNVEIRYNERIHAKLYICWCKEKEEDSFALFGSGNLTSGGLQNNLELGMMMYSRDHGQVLVRDLYEWSTVALRSQSRRVTQVTLTPPMRRK